MSDMTYMSLVTHPVKYNHSMDDKYNISKSKKPETKQELLAAQIEELVKRRDNITNLSEKQKINAEITKLFAQYERLKI